MKVDLELRGCPVSKEQLLATITALLAGRRPSVTSHSVCVECKQAGNACVLVAHGAACLGPVTHAGCQALCPSLQRGCFGCFGPSEAANVDALHATWRATGLDDGELVRTLLTFNAAAPVFADGAQRVQFRAKEDV